MASWRATSIGPIKQCIGNWLKLRTSKEVQFRFEFVVPLVGRDFEL